MTTPRFSPSGLPIYPPRGAPDGMRTVGQLAGDHGMKPGGPPRAILDIGVAGVDLYRLDEAVPLCGDET